jgi:hypothetical protein
MKLLVLMSAFLVSTIAIAGTNARLLKSGVHTYCTSAYELFAARYSPNHMVSVALHPRMGAAADLMLFVPDTYVPSIEQFYTPTSRNCMCITYSSTISVDSQNWVHSDSQVLGPARACTQKR